MGTKKQTLRNRLMAFAVVMVYALVLLPSFALAAGANSITAASWKVGTVNTAATYAEGTVKITADKYEYDIVIPYAADDDFTLTPTFAGGGAATHQFKAGAADVTVDNGAMTVTATTSTLPIASADLAKLVAGDEIAGVTEEETKSIKVKVKTEETAAGNAEADTYTFNITRANASAKNELTALTATTADGTNYIKNFKSTTKSYNVDIPADKANGNLTITATPDALAKAEVSPATVTLAPGMSLTATVKVKAQDGSVNEYKINIKAGQNETDNSLKELMLTDKDAKAYDISPAFNPATRNYVLTVPFTENEIWVKGVANSDNAKAVTYAGAATHAEETTTPSPVNGYEKYTLAEGYNQVVVEGNAQDDSKTTYTIGVTRMAEASTVTVEDIQIVGATFDQKFSAGSLGYTGKSFSNDTGSVIVKTKEAANRVKVTVNGKTLHDNLAAGNAIKSGSPLAIAFVADTKIEVTVEPEVASSTAAVTYIFTLKKDATMTSPGWAKLVTGTETTATIKYDQPKDMDMFAVYLTTDVNTTTGLANTGAKWVCGATSKAGAGQMVVKNLQPGTNYAMKVTAGRTMNGKLTYIPLAATNELNTGLVTTLGWNEAGLVMIASNDTSATFVYGSIADTAGYAIYYKESTATKWTYGNRSMGKAAPLTIKGLNSAKNYDFVLTPGKMINGKMTYLPISSITVGTGKLVNQALNKSGLPVVTTADIITTNSSALIPYSGVTGADSYALYSYNAEKKVYEYVTKTANPVEIIANGLKADTTFEFKLTVGKTVNGKMKYTPLEDITSFTVKTLA